MVSRIGPAATGGFGLGVEVTAVFDEENYVGTGVFLALRMQHLIPPGRLTEEYLSRLVEGYVYSNTILNHLYQLPTPPPDGPRPHGPGPPLPPLPPPQGPPPPPPPP